MRYRTWRVIVHLTVVALVILVAAPVAQAAGPTVSNMKPTASLHAARAVSRIPQGEAQARGTHVEPFRPTLSPTAYTVAKRAAAVAHGSKPDSGPAPEAAPILAGINAEGVNQATACTCAPPDTHGAVGRKHFVEITNRHVDIYTKASSPVHVKGVSLASFFGYTTKPLFDPRVVYDTTWNRWIITADSEAEGATLQKFHIAVSQTSDPTKGFWIYRLNVGFQGQFFDFPDVGMDQDAVLFSANMFDHSGATFQNAEAFGVAKAALYNGLSWGVPIFAGFSVGTVAPPIVLDNAENAYFVSAAPSGTHVYLYQAHDMGRSGATISSAIAVTVPSFSLPPNAPQPGVTDLIDTADARFQNAGYQTGTSLFQVHTVTLGSYAVARWYEIDTAASALVQVGTFYASSTSFDFNPSIAANRSWDVFVTWSSTDVHAKPQVRVSGRRHNDTLDSISGGSALYTSPRSLRTALEPERWGDYSAVSLDPSAYGSCAAGQRAWIVNEKVATSTTASSTRWGTRFARIGFC